jgi:hypothetical protein
LVVVVVVVVVLVVVVVVVVVPRTCSTFLPRLALPLQSRQSQVLDSQSPDEASSSLGAPR